MLVPSDKADIIVTAYNIYKEPSVSLKDVIDHFRENEIDTSSVSYKKGRDLSIMDRSHLSKLLGSPLYVRADVEVYKYLSAKNYRIIDDVEAFDGIHGLFCHKDENGGFFIKVGDRKSVV